MDLDERMKFLAKKQYHPGGQEFLGSVISMTEICQLSCSIFNLIMLIALFDPAFSPNHLVCVDNFVDLNVQVTQYLRFLLI